MGASKKPVISLALAPRLLELCATRGVSFSDLARRANINRTTLTRILKGQRCARPGELSSILRVLRVRQRDFFTPPAVPEQLPEPPARPASPQFDVEALEHQLRLAVEARDDLADQVERLCAELRVERSERVNELAEVRHQHMQEMVELRRHFQAEQMKTLEDAQARDEKASAALGSAIAELNRRDHASTQQGARDGRPAAPSANSSPTDNRSPPWSEAAASIVAGIGGLALGSWLLASKPR
jgi:transcriptional regulator with XRE-family HTH domain